jgi:phospholipase/carboxylesterase
MTITMTNGPAPHGGQRVHHVGAAPAEADAAMILIHGRGASARDILMLASAFERSNVAYFAPQAAGSVWYPQRFIEPTMRNEPYLSAALNTVAGLLADIEAAGIAAERTIILGFSQGACLATEFGARFPRRYGGIVGLSGGLIGTDVEVTAHTGDLKGTPVILGCSDVDFHIPLERVQATTRVLSAMKGQVDETIYPGMGHGVVDDEVRQVQALIDRVIGTTRTA